MAEWSIAAVLKTVVLRGTGGSNPSLSAKSGCFYTSTFFVPFFAMNNSVSFVVVLKNKEWNHEQL